MKLNKLLLYSLLLMISCRASFTVGDSKWSRFDLPENSKPTHIGAKVFVLNPSLEQEFQILNYTRFYEFTTDSSNATLLIRLYPIQKRLASGTFGMPLSCVSCGLKSVYYPDSYRFEYTELHKSDSTNVSFNVEIITKVSSIKVGETDLAKVIADGILQKYNTRH